MSYIFIDTEGSGLFLYNEEINGVKVDVKADDPRQPRMAELAIIFTDDDFNIQREYSALIKPDGWSMTPGATKVNGLTDDILHAQGVPATEALQVYTDAILGEGRAVITFNARHDCKQLRGELRRAGMDDMFELTRNVCAMRSAMSAKLGIKKWDWDNGGPPNLGSQRGWPKQADVLAHFALPQEPKPHRAIHGAQSVHRVSIKLAEIGKLLAPTVHYSANRQSEDA